MYIYNIYYYVIASREKDRVTPQNTQHTKYQYKSTKGLINCNKWQRGTIGYPKAPPLGSTATHTQQCSPKNCKRKASPNPSHHHTIEPLGSTATHTQQCSPKNCKRKASLNPSHHHTIEPLYFAAKTSPNLLTKKLSLRTKHALQKLKYDIHTKIGMKLRPLESYQKLV